MFKHLLSTHQPKSEKWSSIALWLFLIALLIIAMVIVGGFTRLTGSGLSITQWKPIYGAIPPLNLQEWLQEFEAYKQIPQFKLLNASMTLSEFKYIFWWEWGHRQLGRIIGFVFFLPMLFFYASKAIPKTYTKIIFLLFIGGGLQGLIGWLMVKSGLTDRVHVSQYRLAMHLTFALILYYWVLYTAFLLHQRRFFTFPLPSKSLLLTLLVFLQIISGAFTAGTHAGYIYNTWPLMDSAIIPSGLFSTGFVSIFEDRLTIQFIHRSLAIFILLYGLWIAKIEFCKKHYLNGSLITIGLSVQVIIGIITLVTVAPVAHIELAALHQLGGVMVLTICCYINAQPRACGQL